MPENSAEGGCVQMGKLAIDYHKGVMYVSGATKGESAMQTAAEIVADLKEEAAAGLYTLAELSDEDLQHAIDTVGAECSVAEVRAAMKAAEG